MPDTWDRYGYMGGGNFSDVPPTGPYTYSERAIPYIENPNAYHTGSFNRDTYFDKIDAIRDGDLNKLNQILEGEGNIPIFQDQFLELSDRYKKYLIDTSFSLDLPADTIWYGVYGKAAPWGDMIGGAEQIVTPFRGIDMVHLGIMEELK